MSFEITIFVGASIRLFTVMVNCLSKNAPTLSVTLSLILYTLLISKSKVTEDLSTFPEILKLLLSVEPVPEVRLYVKVLEAS